MSSFTRESLQHHCRSCLTNLETKVNDIGLPRLWYHIQTTENLADWIYNLTSLRLLPNTKDYPQFICQDCFEKFRDFRNFQELVWKTADTLDAVITATDDNETFDDTNIEKFVKSELLIEDVEYEYNDIDTKWEEHGVDNTNYADVAGSSIASAIDKRSSSDVEFISPDVNYVENAAERDDVYDDVPRAAKAYKCEQCNRCYAHKYTYIAHMRQDHQGISRAFECEYCHKRYTKFCNLYRHKRLDHNMTLRQFKCEYAHCNRSFRKLTTRRRHYEEYHEPQARAAAAAVAATRPPTPPSPPDSTLLLPELLSPNFAIKAKRFVCCICSESFETLYNLKNHMVCHRDAMKFVCSICGKHKISQMKLDEHYATVHDPKNAYPCNICHKVFKCKSHVSVHILSVHKGLRPFACHYCPSQFAAKNTLKIHERIHTGEKPFACEICGRRFTQLTPMKKHRLIHDKERKQQQEQQTLLPPPPHTDAVAHFALGN